MATNPKYPVEPRPRPRPYLVEPRVSKPPRSFQALMIGLVVLVAAAVILAALWLLKFGGGSPQEQPKPHPTTTPSGLNLPAPPRINPRRPSFYAWAK